MKTVTIRLGRPEDAAGVARVHIDSWRSTYRGIVPDAYLDGLSTERRQEAWARNLSEPKTENFLLVAEDPAGEIAGFASAGKNHEPDREFSGEVYAIYLLEKAQGRGTGRKLVKAAMSELLQRGFKTMIVWVLKANTPARKFYKAMGGVYLREKPVEIGGQWLTEVAYGWNDLNAALSGKE